MGGGVKIFYIVMKKFNNQEWQESYEHDSSFRHKVDHAEEEYETYLQKARQQK